MQPSALTEANTNETTCAPNPLDALHTIPEMLRRTVAVYPEREAFRQFDYQENAWISTSWHDFYEGVMRWRRALLRRSASAPRRRR